MIQAATNSSLAALQLDRLNEDKREKDEELASGKRVNEAKDDPAGLKIASRLSSEIFEANQQAANTQTQINSNNVTGAAVNAINEGLLRAQELAIQSGNPLADPSAIQGELDQITEQVNVIAENALGQSNFLPTLDASDPQATQAALETALESTTNQLTTLGAESNALQSQVNTLQVGSENLSASRSRIEDADYAQGSAETSQLQTLLELAGRTKKEEEDRKGILLNTFV